MSVKAVENAIRQVKKQLEDYPQSERVGHGWRYLEMATRYALIDPVLRALDWDITRPDQCSFEADPKWESWVRPHVDYVLWRPSELAAVVIEAKSADSKLGTQEQEGQLAEYVEGLKSGIAVLTNGKTWYLYNLNFRQREEFGDKKVEEVNVLHGSVRAAAQTLHCRIGAQNWWAS